MGFYLGKFVYLMDALEDVEKDRKKGNYNLFLESGEVWSKEQAPKYKEILTAMAAEAARSFERLPIITCADILRNILYSGVWAQFNKAYPPQDALAQNEGSPQSEPPRN